MGERKTKERKAKKPSFKKRKPSVVRYCARWTWRNTREINNKKRERLAKENKHKKAVAHERARKNLHGERKKKNGERKKKNERRNKQRKEKAHKWAIHHERAAKKRSRERKAKASRERRAKVVHHAHLARIARFTLNVVNLKAWSLEAHKKIKAMAASKSLSVLSQFLLKFGAFQVSNVDKQYMKMMAQFRRKYRKGLAKYMLVRLNQALKNQGALMSTFKSNSAKQIPAKTLNYRALGLQSMPKMFKKLQQPVTQFTYAVASVKSHNKKLRAMVVFRGSKCRCKAAPKKFNEGKIGGHCKKWMSYDKLPWCFVNKGCKGAQKTKTGLYYRSC